MNNPYDPVVGISTSACSAYNVLMTIYRRCVCFASKITVRAINIGNMEAYLYVLGENHDFRHTNGVTRDFIRENPVNLRSKLVFQHEMNMRPTFIRSFRKIKSMEDKKELEPITYGCTISSGPSIPTYWQVGSVYSASGDISTSTTRVIIKIVYYCRLNDRINLDG